MTMRVFQALLLYALIAGLICSTGMAAHQQLQHRPAEQNPRVVICKVMEAHTSREPAVSVVVFHQRNKADAERLRELLKRAADGGAVEIQTSEGGEWRPAAVARLKSCFGRGLLILPPGSTAPSTGSVFLLRFPVGTLKPE
jgi:hypothetical protein